MPRLGLQSFGAPLWQPEGLLQPATLEPLDRLPLDSYVGSTTCNLTSVPSIGGGGEAELPNIAALFGKGVARDGLIDLSRALVRPGQRVDLSAYDPDDKQDLGKTELLEYTAEKLNLIADQKEHMLEAGLNSFLGLLQALDGAGKGGFLDKFRLCLVGGRIYAFKKPTPAEEKEHYLERVDRQMPKKPGRPDAEFVFFDRSHWENILVLWVNGVIDDAERDHRIDEMLAFEEAAARRGVLFAKFFIHISQQEQYDRLFERTQDELKQQKCASGDWTVFQKYERYIQAYEYMLSRTSTPYAPWFILPGNSKTFRSALATGIVEHIMAAYDPVWQSHIRERNKPHMVKFWGELKEMGIDIKALNPKNRKNGKSR